MRSSEGEEARIKWVAPGSLNFPYWSSYSVVHTAGNCPCNAAYLIRRNKIWF